MVYRNAAATHWTAVWGLVTWIFHLTVLRVVAAAGVGRSPSAPAPVVAYAMVGRPFLLNCTAPRDLSGSSIMWMNPWDNSPISSGYDVIPSLQREISVVGDPHANQYHLYLHSVRFPQHNGTWSCTGFGGWRRLVSLTVLVPPAASAPTISPANLSVIDFTSEAWTFTCVSQFAYPPAMLSWTRLSGPARSTYAVTPPGFLVSTTGTMSASIKLVLTPADSGSIFECKSTHPSFGGRFYSQKVAYGMPRASAMVQGEPPNPMRKVQLDQIDTAIVIVICGLAAFVCLSAMFLFRGRGKWEVDVRLRNDYVRVPTVDVEVPVTNGARPASDKSSCSSRSQSDSTSTNMQARRRCITKLAFGITFSGLLLFSLSIAIPVYIKGVTPPDLGTDMFTSVIAGSALWLECSDIATPAGSVLQVTWYKEHRKFYHQFPMNGKNIGFPENSTFGYQLGFRVTSVRTGQVNIWPVMPGEDGVFMCEATMIADNDGKTLVKRKTFGVFVVTGIIYNMALLVLLGIALTSALGLVLLGFYHSLRCVYYMETQEVS